MTYSQSTIYESDCGSMDSSKARKLEPGIYKFVNYTSGTALDLSGGDNKSIIGFPLHGGENQQWDIAPLGSGYSIRSVSNGAYLTVEAGIHNGVPIVATPFPVSWVFELDECEDGTVQIIWPNTQFAFDLSAFGSATPGTQIQLWQKYPFEPFRLWRLIRCEEDTASSTVADTVIDTRGLDRKCLTITTTTTTTTTVTKVIRAGG